MEMVVCGLVGSLAGWVGPPSLGGGRPRGKPWGLLGPGGGGADLSQPQSNQLQAYQNLNSLKGRKETYNKLNNQNNLVAPSMKIVAFG